MILARPLRSRNFRLLVTCNIISTAGTAVCFVAIPFAVLGIKGSPGDPGYVSWDLLGRFALAPIRHIRRHQPTTQH